ncbi:oligopeptide/dipeptide ABC transporter, ATP-binding protein [Fibrobacter succinogenes subsp. succinogenes S85]|uniref:Oligopeptide/dipeptide ABC transporter, ATP-binding protein n=1 Tax=Fibrobacter succinogenes (strain ATCC 19169 / S85) TaxID=59374 RepID=C9RJL0_FIBSS|nr:ABC transporter ATP-binding protein [Fibrobacter succinogenes]ACX73723.1 oligopeptide/dipeptide ABC transporter, ATPase subunit [Fibrobacter succinogenes subsp. succinogenes S85]ADL26489.1 oligopeptide/dipeptide ABC transporter, ATP-binding protein [Fibrobacter succinogenes subsp. succinogenes S85]
MFRRETRDERREERVILSEVEGSSKVPVLRVKEVSVAFGFDKNGNSRDGRKPLQVTDRVSFDIFPGEFFALVGESGCGKSVTAMSILRLLPWPSAKIVNGEILFDVGANDAQAQDSRDADDGNANSRDLATLPLKDLQSVRGSEIACIFQEPMQALNPVVTIKKQLLEVFKFGAVSKNTQSKQDSAPSRGSSSSSERSGGDPVNSPLDLIREQLRLAGFNDPDRVLNSYSHELSGGMLQRVCIVMALLPKPKLIIADEPTTALDVTVQAQVLAVLKEMAEKTGTAVLLITHNMGIVSQYAHRVAVMYAGRIVEEGPVREVINHPMHPYTQGLLAAIPESHSDLRTLASIPGAVPHPKDFAKGCRFADRCCKCAQASAEVREKCLSAELPTKIAEANHFAYCFCAK